MSCCLSRSFSDRCVLVCSFVCSCVHLYSLFNPELSAARCGDLKAVFSPYSGTELYNVARDPDEKNDLLRDNRAAAEEALLQTTRAFQPGGKDPSLQALASQWYRRTTEFRQRTRVLHSEEKSNWDSWIDRDTQGVIAQI